MARNQRKYGSQLTHYGNQLTQYDFNPETSIIDGTQNILRSRADTYLGGYRGYGSAATQSDYISGDAR